MTTAPDPVSDPSEPSEPSPRPRHRRPPLWRMVARDVLVVPVLLMALGAAFWTQRVPVVDGIARLALDRAGLGPVALTVQTVETDGLVITDVALADGRFQARRLFVVPSLLGVERIEAEGVAVRAPWDPETGLDAGPLTPWLSGGEGDGDSGAGGAVALPIRTLEVRDARLSLEVPEGTVRAETDATLTLWAGLAGALTNVVFEGTDVGGLMPGTATIPSVRIISPRLSVDDGVLSGPLTLTGEAKDVAVPDARLSGATVAASGRLRASPDRIDVALDTGEVILTEPAFGSVWNGGSALTLVLAEDADQTVAVDLAGPGTPRADLDVTLAPFSVSGTVEADLDRVHLAGPVPWSNEAPLTLVAAASRVQSGAAVARDATVDATLRPEGPTATLAFQVPHLPGEAGTDSIAGHPLRPLRVQGQLAPDPEQPGRLRVTADLGAPLRDHLVTLRGWATADARNAHLSVRGAPLTLGDGGVQPWQLHAALADLSASAGTVAIEGTVDRTDGGALRPDLSFGLADVDAAYGTTALRRLNGVARLTGLSPLRSPSQELVAAGLEMGLPFTDVVIRYRLDGAGAFVVEEASMALAGGTIVTDGARVPLAGFDRVPLTLTVQGLDLGQLAAMTPIDDLTVSGRVDGTVPMVITPGAVRIDAGRLAATGPGVVQYRGGALPGGAEAGTGVDLARRALEDFRYTALSMDVAGSTADTMALTLSLDGANAAVLDGYPFQLNLNLEGPLTRLIGESLQGYTIPRRIVDRLKALGLR
ncbi:hypothetical protein F1188_03655 [Roseospira marina]|uniref:Uncharacterized protein n=1 Tax=Roseospira marina TaxID=140057 RepID=A0A5M6IFL1_9PROT|nr:YdbH domain-containing protein [Roseospira marina]KAA5607013.1 hypothetical protein F1188_03655 [Roseospira marina]MBB4312803.1 hypothetical protein [Roseospira marina]MBB5086424.1 hypothetical protein [Roseospira marina]